MANAHSQATLDRTFLKFQAAAIAGERCPQNHPFGPIPTNAAGQLARGGRIKIEVFTGNWRVVTIMEGPHKGKRTAAAPAAAPAGKGTGKPYRVVYKDHVLVAS